MNSRQKL